MDKNYFPLFEPSETDNLIYDDTGFFVAHISIVGSRRVFRSVALSPGLCAESGFIDFQVERNRLENELNFFPLHHFVPEDTRLPFRPRLRRARVLQLFEYLLYLLFFYLL